MRVLFDTFWVVLGALKGQNVVGARAFYLSRPTCERKILHIYSLRLLQNYLMLSFFNQRYLCTALCMQPFKALSTIFLLFYLIKVKITISSQLTFSGDLLFNIPALTALHNYIKSKQTLDPPPSQPFLRESSCYDLCFYYLVSPTPNIEKPNRYTYISIYL